VLKFTSDTNTGIYRYGNDQIGFAAGGNCKLIVQSSSIVPFARILPANDNSYSLGGYVSPNYYRWTDVWAVNGTIQTSDEAEKVILGDAPGLEVIERLRPVGFRWNHKDAVRRHFGLIGQQVGQVIEELGIDSKDFAPLVVTEDGGHHLRYTEFIPILIRGIQEMQEYIEKLENRIETLEAAA